MVNKLIIGLLVALAMVSCNINLNGRGIIKGNGNIVKKELVVTDYDKVKINGSQSFIYEQKTQDAAKLFVEIDENLAEYVKAKVSGGKLEIYLDGVNSYSLTKFVVSSNSKNLSEVSVSGSGKFISDGQIKADDVMLKVSGSGKINLNKLVVGSVTSSVSGSGNVTLKGMAQSSNLSVSGSGSIDVYELSQSESTCSVSGSGRIKTTAKDKLKLSVSGSGEIEYAGNAHVEQSKSGSGKIVKLD